MRDRLREAIAFVGGHADMWAVFRDAALLYEVVHALGRPFDGHDITKVAGVESRGFILGAPVALGLGAGFVAIRKEGGVYPGPKVERSTEDPDYRGHTHHLRVQRAGVQPGDRVLLVDDWIETGNQAAAARSMIVDCGAEVVAISVVVDQLTDMRRAELGAVHSLISATDLQPDH
jgi:adenine phosphoribosyltransferase